MVKPSFLFVGPSKSGSTWFFEVLREHPSVFVPWAKGTFFFNAFHNRGNTWYEKFFAEAAANQVTGEVCHDYLSDPLALARIREYRSDIKIICCLRCPYERAVSSWRFSVRNGEKLPTLGEYARRSPGAFEDGYYATHLASVFANFPPEQVLIFFFRELASQPEKVVRRLYEFIGVEASFNPPSLYKQVNGAAAPRWRIAAKAIARLDIYARQHGMETQVAKLKRIRWLRQAVRRTLYKPSVDNQDWRTHVHEFPQHVVERYECEIRELELICEKDLSNWCLSQHPPEVVQAQVAAVEISRQPTG